MYFFKISFCVIILSSIVPFCSSCVWIWRHLVQNVHILIFNTTCQKLFQSTPFYCKSTLNHHVQRSTKMHFRCSYMQRILPKIQNPNELFQLKMTTDMSIIIMGLYCVCNPCGIFHDLTVVCWFFCCRNHLVNETGW